MLYTWNIYIVHQLYLNLKNKKKLKKEEKKAPPQTTHASSPATLGRPSSGLAPANLSDHSGLCVVAALYTIIQAQLPRCGAVKAGLFLSGLPAQGFSALLPTGPSWPSALHTDNKSGHFKT